MREKRIVRLNGMKLVVQISLSCLHREPHVIYSSRLIESIDKKISKATCERKARLPLALKETISIENLRQSNVFVLQVRRETKAEDLSRPNCEHHDLAQALQVFLNELY